MNGIDISATTNVNTNSSSADLTSDLLDSSGGLNTTNTLDGTTMTVAAAVDISSPNVIATASATVNPTSVISEQSLNLPKSLIAKSTPTKRKALAAGNKYKSPMKVKRLSWSQLTKNSANKSKKSPPTAKKDKNGDDFPMDVDMIENKLENQTPQTLTAAVMQGTEEIGKSKDAQQYIEFIVKGIKITNQNIMDLLDGHLTSDNVSLQFFF